MPSNENDNGLGIQKTLHAFNAIEMRTHLACLQRIFNNEASFVFCPHCYESSSSLHNIHCRIFGVRFCRNSECFADSQTPLCNKGCLSLHAILRSKHCTEILFWVLEFCKEPSPSCREFVVSANKQNVPELGDIFDLFFLLFQRRRMQQVKTLRARFDVYVICVDCSGRLVSQKQATCGDL